MKYSTTKLCIHFILFLWGIWHPTQAVQAQEASYYPLKVGNRWEYRQGDRKIVTEVVEEAKFDGLTCFCLKTHLGDKSVQEYLADTKTGLVRVRLDSDEEIKPPLLLLKLPFQKGQAWKVESKIGNAIAFGTFQEERDKVKVPAGLFDTIKVQSKEYTIRGTKMDLTMWFAADVGMVKQRVEISGVVIDLELQTYSVSR